MPAENMKRTLVALAIGLCLQLLAPFAAHLSGSGSPGIFLAVLGQVLFIQGCSFYAQSKGYSPWFGLSGIASVLGLMVLFSVPDELDDDD